MKKKKLCVLIALAAMVMGTNAQAVKVGANGNVGIGRENPIRKLDVRLDANEEAFLGTRWISTGKEDGVKIGNYSYSTTCGAGKYPAIYNPSGGIFFGIPTQWAHCTYSSNIYYTNMKQFAVATNITPCHTAILQNVRMVNTYMAEVSGLEASLVRGDSEPEQKQYVFLAEELREVFPQLVSTYEPCGEEEDAKLAIDYTGMVPILTAAINEQQTIIETQQEEISSLQEIAFGQGFDLTELYELRDMVDILQATVFIQQDMIDELRDIVLACCEHTSATLKQRDTSSAPNNNNQNRLQQSPVLYQNIPNPFSSNTEISCEIPTAFTGAFIYIYNLQGVELMSFPIVQTGFSTVMVSASALPAGMYLYTLVVDNQIIDSKRMILTK